MNKKLTSILLASAMVLSLGLTACGGGKTAESKAPEATKAAEPAASQAAAPTESKAAEPAKTEKGKIAYIVGNLGDKSFNDSGEKGMNVLRGEGWDVKTIETGEAQDKYLDFILDALDAGYEYLVGSSTYSEKFLEVCGEYPDAKFLIFDDVPADEAAIPANVAYISYAQNEGSYLVGLMAAGMSKTKTVAVNVGMDNPIIADFVTGFIQGVKDKDPEVKVIKAAVGSWSDAATMKTICEAQARDNNADVFYQVAGGCGFGMFEACTGNGTWAIGVDSDQYADMKEGQNPEQADCILTSMLKEVGNSFVTFFHQVADGKDVWGKYQVLGAADGAVGYAVNENFEKNVPQELRDEMAAVGESVKAGKLTIKSYFDFKDEAEYNAYLDDARK